MKNYRFYIAFISFCMFSCNFHKPGETKETFSETNSNDDFKVKKFNVKGKETLNNFLLFNDVKLLDDATNKRLKKSGVQNFLRLTTRMIDKNADGYYEAEKIKAKVEAYFPDKDSEGFCVIDWEREAFEKLKNHKKNKSSFEQATIQYVKLIEFIKDLRPNVRVGVYGLPFRQNTIQNPTKHYPTSTTERILAHTDFLAPSLYMLYSIEEIGEKATINYIKMNLNNAFAVSNNKPIYAYVGYRIYSKKSRSSWEIISPKDFEKYIEWILTEQNEDDKINGLILWNGDYIDFRDKRNTFSHSNIREDDFHRKYNSDTYEYFLIIKKVLKKLNMSGNDE